MTIKFTITSVTDLIKKTTQAFVSEKTHFSEQSCVVGSLKKVGSHKKPAIYALLLAGVFSFNAGAGHIVKQKKRWFGSWSASPQANVIFRPPFTAEPLNDQTVRNIVHLSLGGAKIRVRLSNTFGDGPLTFNAASVGVAGNGSAIKPGTLSALTFGGESSITIPAGADIFSDPVSLHVADNSDLAISLYVANLSPSPTIDDVTNKTSYISASGDFTASEQMAPGTGTIDVSYFASGVDVLSHGDTKTIVVLGDSITDGFGSTMDSNSSYPSRLSQRLSTPTNAGKTSVLNAAISGNRLLASTSIFGPSALGRLDTDALSQSGISHIILQIGINDIAFPEIAAFLPPEDNIEVVTAAQIIAGMKQVILKAHTRGIKICAGTLLPYRGAAFYNAEGEAKRQAVNQWIRNSGAFDAVIDFDLAMQDPNDPAQLRAEFHNGDFLHPNDAGYQQMADSIDLKLFQ